MKKPPYSKEELTFAIKDSSSMAEVLRKLGRKDNSGNYQTLQKYARYYQLTLPRKIGGTTIAATLKVTRPLEEILVENSTYLNTSNLKTRLLKAGLLQNVCAIDGQTATWNGEPLVFVLDHINGNNTDNRIENLRLLCPNCNSQQSTFCRGQRGYKV